MSLVPGLALVPRVKLASAQPTANPAIRRRLWSRRGPMCDTAVGWRSVAQRGKVKRCLATVGLTLIFAIAGCGGSEKEVNPAQAAFEGAEIIPLGRGAILELDPGTQSAEQRYLLARVIGGRWTADGLRIPPRKVDALCMAHFLTAEACNALGR
jgi:hypothetical protein